MRTRLVVVAMLLACSSSKDKDGTGPKPPAGTEVATGSPDVPKVERASLLAADDGKPPPLLVVIDDPRPPARNEKVYDMPVRVAFATSWAALAKQAPEKTAKPGTVDLAYKVAREAAALGQTPEQVWRVWESNPVDLSAGRDDPPPPEEEDKPDDGADESGGTGQAMALEEGKMGKKDSDRAEGQYRMKKTSDPAPLPKAPPRGERGPLLRMPPKPEWDDGNPSRLADVAGEVMPDGVLGPQHIAIIATPRTNAQRLALAIGALAGAVVVAHAGTVRPLHIDFTPVRDGAMPASRWVEVRVAKQGFAVEAVPDVPLAAADASQLAATIEKARALRKLPPDAPVDLLVDADANAQRLVDLLVALEAAGVRVVGIGAAPAAGSDEARRRGHRNPTIVVGQPNSQGDLDKQIIRRIVRAAQPELLACYTTALAKQPELAGTVQTQFLITQKGKVGTASASGVDPAVATCVAAVIKKLEFPKPKGSGMVQVNYPFTMRP